MPLPRAQPESIVGVENETISILLVRVLLPRLSDEAARTLLDQLEIAPAVLAEDTSRIPREIGKRAWALAPTLSGDPLFGLRVGAQLSFGAFGLVEMLVRTSYSLEEAVERFAHHYRILAGRDAVALERQGSCTSVVYRDDHSGRHVVECFVSTLCRIPRELWPGFSPAAIHFRHAPAAPRSEYEAILGGPVRFGERVSRVVFEHAQLQRVLPATQRQVLASVNMPADDDGLLTKVRLLIEAALSTRGCSADAIARRLNMGERTLRRRLAEHGTTFSRLVDETRRDLARRHLVRTASSIHEVGQLVGFSDQRAFARAFKRWTGLSPMAFRAALPH